MDSRYKFIFKNIKVIAQANRMSEAEYKEILAREAAKRNENSLAKLTHIEWVEVRSRIMRDLTGVVGETPTTARGDLPNNPTPKPSEPHPQPNSATISQNPKGRGTAATSQKEKDPLDVQRKKLLSLGYDMGYHKPRTEAQKGMLTPAVNFENVNNWCKSPKCPVSKDMREMDEKEINKAVTAFKKVKASFFKGMRNA